MENLKFYCLGYSKLSNKLLSIYEDLDNNYNLWDNFSEKYRNTNLKIDEDYLFPLIQIENKKRQLSDFYFMMGGVLVVSKKAREVLSDLIVPTCQILPFHEIKGEMYYAVHCFQAIDCIDIERSKFYYNPSSPETSLNQGEPIYFVEENVPQNVFFFKVPLNDSSYYCKKEFVERVLEHKLVGLGFRDPRVHELTSIAGNTENPVPEVEKFKLGKKY
jgi:hypothetical protein